MTDPFFSAVVPVHNEAEVLVGEVEDILAGLASAGSSHELVLVENGSTDDTASLADALADEHEAVRSLHLPFPDYGAAMKRGMAAARGQVVLNFDIDYHSAQFVGTAARRLESCGIVVGSKLHAESTDRRNPLRRLVSLVFTLVLKALFDPQIDDTHGIKAFRRDVIDSLLPQTCMSQDLFDTELVIRARRAGIEVCAVPVLIEEKRKPRSSIVRRIPRTIRGLLRLRLILWKEQLGRPR